MSGASSVARFNSRSASSRLPCRTSDSPSAWCSVASDGDFADSFAQQRLRVGFALPHPHQVGEIDPGRDEQRIELDRRAELRLGFHVAATLGEEAAEVGAILGPVCVESLAGDVFVGGLCVGRGVGGPECLLRQRCQRTCGPHAHCSNRIAQQRD